MSVLSLSLKLIILIAIGFTAKKTKILPNGADGVLSKLVLNVSLPAIIISSFSVELTREDLRMAGLLLLTALGVIVLEYLAGQAFYLLSGKSGPGRVCRLGLLITNFTFFGIPVVESLYGARGLLYFTVFTIPFRLLYYMGTPLLLAGGGGEKRSIRGFFNVPVISIFVGAAIWLTGLRLPSVVDSTVSALAATATPLGLVLCGVTLTGVDFRTLFRRPLVLAAAAVRLAVLPGAALGLGLLIGLKADALRCAVTYCALPCASLIPAYVVGFMAGDRESESSAGVLVLLTSLLCIAAIPLWALAMNRLL